MLEFVGTLVAIVVAVGSIIVSVTTQLNHVKHCRDDIDRHSGEIKDLFGKVEIVNDGMGKLHAEVESNHSEIVSKLDGMARLCDERHK